MFPATTSNQITYTAFCTLGGLASGRVQKCMHHNGSMVYFTYHLLYIR